MLQTSIPREINVWLNGGGYMIANLYKAHSAMEVRFDACTAPNWNIQGELYGRLAIGTSNQDCIPFFDHDRSKRLKVERCVTSISPDTASTWFKAQFDSFNVLRMITWGDPNNHCVSLIDTTWSHAPQENHHEAVIVQPQNGITFTVLQMVNVTSV